MQRGHLLWAVWSVVGLSKLSDDRHPTVSRQIKGEEAKISHGLPP
jgi:hypothetical protein